jgi:HEAT repeat protein
MKRLILSLAVAILFLGCVDSSSQLMKKLSDDSPMVRASALKELSQQDEEQIYSIVMGALEDRSVVVRIAAIRALAGFKSRDTIVALVRSTKDTEVEVRREAILALRDKGGQSTKLALIELLLAGEPDKRLRQEIYTFLEQMGLSGKQLSDEMAEVQMQHIMLAWEESTGVLLVRLVRQAGRSVHPEGINIVLASLDDTNVDVIIMAINNLDGRGQKVALEKLDQLSKSRIERVRTAAIGALSAYGKQGLEIIKPMLDDIDSKIRLEALKTLAASQQTLDPARICSLLQDEDQAVAREAARLVKLHEFTCDLSSLVKQLSVSDDRFYRAIGLLARSGYSSPKLLKKLKRVFDLGLKDIQKEKDKKKVSPKRAEIDYNSIRDQLEEMDEQELRELFKQHGLDLDESDIKAHSIRDILAAFPAESDDRDLMNYSPQMRENIDQVGLVFEALLFLDSKSAIHRLKNVLKSDLELLIAKVVEIFNQSGLKYEINPSEMKLLGTLIIKAKLEESAPVIRFVKKNGKEKGVAILLSLLEGIGFEKREVILKELVGVRHPRIAERLEPYLMGYSAGSAARIIGEIGDPAHEDILKKALRQAGPGEELDILLALAKTKKKEVVPMIKEKVNHFDPLVRLAVVDILEEIGGKEAKAVLESMQFDLDRIVRNAVIRALGKRR